MRKLRGNGVFGGRVVVGVVGSFFLMMVEGDEVPTYEMEETVVVGDEGGGGEEESGESRVGVVHEVDSSELWEQMVRSFPEALERVPGVMVQKTANGHGSPYIRGFTGYRTLTSLDGIRYNNSVYRDGPSEYFGLIDHFAIEELGVLNGPQAVRYGGDAVGGVLRVETRGSGFLEEAGGEHFQHGQVSYRFAGAEKSHQTRLEYQVGVGEDWGLHLGGSWKDFGAVRAAEVGTQEKTGYGEYGWDAKFERALRDRWVLTVAHQGLEQDDVWRSHSTVFGTSFAGTTVGTDLRRLKDQSRTLSYAKLRGEPVDGWFDEVEVTASVQTWDEDGDRVRADGRRAEESFDSKMWGLNAVGGRELGWGRLTLGGEVYLDEVDSARTDTTADGVATEAVQGPVGDDAEYWVMGVFSELEIPIASGWVVHLGGRYSHTRIDVGRYLDPLTGLAASYEDSWDAVVGSAQISWEPEEGQRYWSGLSQSFRAPNLADVSRYGGSRSTEIESAAIGLEPETFLTWETGARWGGEWGRLQAAYYLTWMDDAIVSTPTGRIVDGETEVTKRNSAEGFVQGVELDGQLNLGGGWSVEGQFTWLEGEVDAFDVSGSLVREPLSRVMPLTVRGAVRWRGCGDRFWVELEAIHAREADQLSSGDQEDTQRIPPGGTPGYTVLNLRSGYEFDENLTLNASVTNLTNEAYRVHGSGDNAPGAGLNLGFRYRF